MTGNRRELPRSSVAGHRRAVPHRGCEGSPSGWTHPLLEAERFCLASGGAEWLLGRDRPDEAGELAGAGDNDLLARLAAGGHPSPAPVEALLAAPGAGADERVLEMLTLREPLADLRSPAG